jgi:2TM domain
MSGNPNYSSYVQTALQIQRWRDFQAHVFAYVVINVAFIIIWAVTGPGFFWPAFPLIGWAFGLSFQHFSVVVRGQITDADIRRKLRPGADGPPDEPRQRQAMT